MAAVRKFQLAPTRGNGPDIRVTETDDGRVVEVHVRVGATVTYAWLDRLQQTLDDYLPLMDGMPPLTYAEAAEAIGVSVKWLQRRVAARTIPFTTVGQRVRFLPEHVRFIRERNARGPLR